MVCNSLAARPKAELHLHMEGAIPLPLLFAMIKRSGDLPGIGSIEDLAARFSYRDFHHFLYLWAWKNQFITNERDFEQIAYAVLANARQQNILYAEMFISPADHTPRGLTAEGIIAATLAGCANARRDCGIVTQIIIDLVRDSGLDSGWRSIEAATPFLGRGVVGIGLGGTEDRFPPDPYRELFAEARRRGFRLTAHAGEGAGPASVWAALDELGAERIGHGTRAIEDGALMARLRDQQIPLEMCIMSNIRTGVTANAGSHPIKPFYQNGLVVTVNSDDPVMFGATIADEYRALADDLHLAFTDIKQIALNGIRASFLTGPHKQDWITRFEQEWAL